MSVRFIGPETKMGPVAVDDTAVIARNQFVRVLNGEVTTIVAGADENLAVAMDKYPDDEYEGTKVSVDLALLGEDQEIEVPFVTTDSGGIAQTDIGNGPFELTADGVVDLEETTDGVFIIRRLGRETSLGDLTGFVVGVVTDEASF